MHVLSSKFPVMRHSGSLHALLALCRGELQRMQAIDRPAPDHGRRQVRMCVAGPHVRSDPTIVTLSDNM